MDPVVALGAVATLVAVAFTCCTLDRWLRRRRPHELAWTEALAMFALASGAYWWAGAAGWSAPVFRVFYLFGAILNVPYLAVGTVHLLGGPRIGRLTHRTLDLVAMFCAGVVLVAPMGPLPATGLPEGKEVFGPLPRVMAAVGSGVGATVLVVGAIWSAVSLVRAKRRPAAGAVSSISPARLAWTNTLIALGSLVLGLGGTFFAEQDLEVGFGVFLVAGIVILFAGFLISSPAPERDSPRSARPPEALTPFMDELWEIATRVDRPGDRAGHEVGG